MSRSTSFAVAIHLLVVLSHANRKFVSSETLAAGVQTNPVVVRRVLARLRNAGLVDSQPGVLGGSRLAVKAIDISLLDAYRAVRTGSLFSLHTPAPDCPIGGRIPEVLGENLALAEEAMEEFLEEVSIEELAGEILPGYSDDLRH